MCVFSAWPNVANYDPSRAFACSRTSLFMRDAWTIGGEKCRIRVTHRLSVTGRDQRRRRRRRRRGKRRRREEESTLGYCMQIGVVWCTAHTVLVTQDGQMREGMYVCMYVHTVYPVCNLYRAGNVLHCTYSVQHRTHLHAQSS